jgi:5S rRNA maturation endonuclease (ribonuclease M5)
VIVCEGEKDAKRVTDLHLTGDWGLIIGVTSGGASTWDPSLAKELAGKRVIVLPDDDAAGTAYAEAIIASLKTENIEYRVATFQGSEAKDASDFLDSYTVEDFVRLLGPDWVRMPDGTSLEVPEVGSPQNEMCDLDFEDIVF